MMDVSMSVQVLKLLEQQSDQVPYMHDICGNDECACVFRGDFADLDMCPRCRQPRSVERTHKARKKLIYFSVVDWPKGLFANEYLARYLYTLSRCITRLAAYVVYRTDWLKELSANGDLAR